jgi:cadmium resistance protein CadD (predicted permease)
MRIGCLGLIGLTLFALFFFQLIENSAKSFLTVIPIATGIWFFLYLQNRKDEADWD